MNPLFSAIYEDIAIKVRERLEADLAHDIAYWREENQPDMEVVAKADFEDQKTCLLWLHKEDIDAFYNALRRMDTAPRGYLVEVVETIYPGFFEIHNEWEY